MNKNIGFVIQARTGSSRLPNKILLPFYKRKNVFQIIIERIRKEFSFIPIVVATSDLPQDDMLFDLSRKLGVECIRGPEENVLARFLKVCETFNFDYVIRVCSDNPFLDVNSIHKQLTSLTNNESLIVDYISFKVNETPSIQTHFGLWAELVSTRALFKSKALANKEKYFEHVTNFIYEHPYLFNIKWLPVPKIISQNTDIRLTLDTEEDYVLLKELFENIRLERVPIKDKEIVNFLLGKPSLIKSMKYQIINNKK